MSRRKKDPLRELTESETQTLQEISRSQTASAAQVTRAKILLCVAQGHDYQEAARAVGHSNVEVVSLLVSCFNAGRTPRPHPASWWRIARPL
jgi:hypothetical protein